MSHEIDEKALFRATTDTLLDYEDTYVFYNSRGSFLDRLSTNLRGRDERFLRAAIVQTLTSCYEKRNGLSVPSFIREEIEDEIFSRYHAELSTEAP